MNASLRFENEQGVALLTISRPARRNALSKDLLAQISQVLDQAAKANAHAVVLSSADGFFSAGADLHELEGTRADASFDDAVAATVRSIREAPMPVIAAIEGGCIGAALDVALGCDLRVVAEGAFLELPAIRLGLLYSPAAVARMRQVLPFTTLSRLLLAGERIEGRDAVITGLASHIAADGQALMAAKTLAMSFKTLAPQVVHATKRFLVALTEPAVDMETWQAERLALLASPARREAVARAKMRAGV